MFFSEAVDAAPEVGAGRVGLAVRLKSLFPNNMQEGFFKTDLYPSAVRDPIYCTKTQVVWFSARRVSDISRLDRSESQNRLFTNIASQKPRSENLTECSIRVIYEVLKTEKPAMRGRVVSLARTLNVRSTQLQQCERTPSYVCTEPLSQSHVI